MSQKSVLITGANGAIGMALCRVFAHEGYRVIATDRNNARVGLKNDAFVSIDLDQFCYDSRTRDASLAAIRKAIMGTDFTAIINNAALQVVKQAEQLALDEWVETLNVNLLSPFLLIQSLLPELEATQGAVVNISSIHAKLTKPGFAAYATSKAAMEGLTRSLAVEWGARIRVNGISPAAISTPMLAAGFEGSSVNMQQLEAMHPTGTIGQPDEVAKLALYLVSDTIKFMNGTTVEINGGIGCRLHDPA